MTALTGSAELTKVGAFLRRDFLMAWSYRTAFLSDFLNLFGQAFIFAFVAKLVDGPRVLAAEGSTGSYLAFVTVGLTISAFLQMGMSRLVGVIAGERFLGTLEPVLLSPTKFSTLQLGWVAYDLIYVPVRTLIFFAVMTALFGVELHAGGVLPALAFLVVFLPFVWGIGVAAAAAGLVFRRGAALTGVGSFALTFTSGAYFPLTLFPRWLQLIAEFNPVALAVRGSRDALLAGAGWSELLSPLALLAALSLFTLGVGVRLFRAAFAKELANGGIGLY